MKIWTPDDGLNDNEGFERAKGLDTWTFECRFGKAILTPDEMSPKNFYCGYNSMFIYNNGLVLNDYYTRNMKDNKRDVHKHVEAQMSDRDWRDYKVEQPNIVRDRNKQEKKLIEKEMNDEPEGTVGTDV